MTDITKEQIEDILNIARMLDNRGLLDLGLVVKIKQLAISGLEAAAEIERLIHNGEKLLSETLNMADKAQNYEKDLLAALKRIEELETTMIDAIEYPEEAVNEGDRILHNRKLALTGEPQ